jgi:hypothetical protein
MFPSMDEVRCAPNFACQRCVLLCPFAWPVRVRPLHVCLFVWPFSRVCVARYLLLFAGQTKLQPTTGLLCTPV